TLGGLLGDGRPVAAGAAAAAAVAVAAAAAAAVAAGVVGTPGPAGTRARRRVLERRLVARRGPGGARRVVVRGRGGARGARTGQACVRVAERVGEPRRAGVTRAGGACG